MATSCPPAVRPRNCKAAIKAAEAGGWKWRCTLSAGFLTDSVELTWSVMLRLLKEDIRLVGYWEGASKDELSWAGGWRRERYVTQVNWTEFSAEIKGWPEKKPTAKAQAELESAAAEHLRAIAALRPIAWPIAVIKLGTKDRACKGKVRVEHFWLPCAGMTDGRPICENCFAGTVYADEASKTKTEGEDE